MVKVLDLGLAKALEPVSLDNVSATASPTITSPEMGVQSRPRADRAQA